MAQILKGAPVVAAMNEANAARCAALKEKGIVPTLAVVRVGAREDINPQPYQKWHLPTGRS